MKNYLYLNAIIDGLFKDLPSQRKFLPNYEQILTKYRGNNASLLDPRIPKVYSYFALRSKNEETAPVMIFTKSQRHSSEYTASEGAFVQHIGWEWVDGLMLKSINEIFEAEFYSEEEVVRELGKSGKPVDIPGGQLGTKKNPEIKDIEIDIHPDAKKAILSSVFMRWFWDWEPIVRIAVPDGVDYNSYVISAVKEIYKLFPVAMRTEVGFCSYTPDKKNVIRRVYLGFVPASQGDEICLYLDGSNRAAINKLTRSTNSANLDAFIDFIANAPAALLPDFFKAVYNDVEASCKGNITLFEPSDYEAVSRSVQVLGVAESVEAKLNAWTSFYENRSAHSSNLRDLIGDHIEETIDVDAFCEYFKSLCSKHDDVSEQLHLFDSVSANIRRLAEALRKAFVEVLRSKGLSEQEIYEKLNGEEIALKLYFENAHIEEARRNSVDERFEKLRKMPAASLDEIELVWQAAMQLQADVAGYEQTEAIAERKTAIGVFVKELAEIRNHAKLAGHTAVLEEMKARPSNAAASCDARIAELADLKSRIAADEELKGSEALLAEVDAYGAELKDKKNDSKLAEYIAELNALKAASGSTVADCDARIAEQEALKARIAADEALKNAEELQAEVDNYGAELKEKRNVCKLADYHAELEELKKQSVENEEDCCQRQTELTQLTDRIVAELELSGHEELKQAVIAFDAELKEKRSAYKLEAYNAELENLKKISPNSWDACVKCIEEVTLLRCRIAEDKLLTDGEALVQAVSEYSDELEAKRKALRTAQFERANEKIDLRAISTAEEAEASAQTLRKLRVLAERDDLIDREAVLAMLSDKQVELEAREYEIYEDRVQALIDLSTDSVAEIEDCIQKAEALKREILFRDFASKDKLVELLAELMKEKKEQSRNTGVMLAEAGAAIAEAGGYFKRLQAYDACDKRFFDEAQLAQLLDLVKQQRPEKLIDYRQAFKEQYGEAMTLSALAKCPELICREILKDVCDYRRIVVGYPYKLTAVDAVAVLGGANGVGFCGDGAEVFVKFGGNEYSEQWFRQLLGLSHTHETMGDAAVFADTFKKLMNDGAYTAADLVKCVTMLKNCRLDYKPVLSFIAEAKISGGSREQYMLMYYAILELFGGQNREEVLAEMQKAHDSMQKNHTAKNALKVFIDRNCAEAKSAARGDDEQSKADAPAKGKSMVKIAVTAVVGLALIAGAFVGGMFLGKGTAAEEVVEVTPTPVVTVKPVEIDPAAEYIDGLKLLYVNGGIDFDACSEQVQQSYGDAGDELKAILEQQYAENNEHTVELPSGKTVEWEEFFFWKCWMLAGETAEVQLNAFQTTEYDGRVMAILNAIHGEKLTADELTADEENTVS